MDDTFNDSLESSRQSVKDRDSLPARIHQSCYQYIDNEEKNLDVTHPETRSYQDYLAMILSFGIDEMLKRIRAMRSQEIIISSTQLSFEDIPSY